jgi:NAD(P)-dependent dehydrogenase (short-subunit alcohol dehydrogenase family)
MASLASVRELAGNVGDLDGAVLNAGIASENWDVGPEGWEMILQVNVLSTALLGLLLLRKMAAAARKKEEEAGVAVVVPTISVVSSHMYFFTDFDALVGAEGNIIRALNDETKFGRKES